MQQLQWKLREAVRTSLHQRGLGDTGEPPSFLSVGAAIHEVKDGSPDAH